MGLAFTIDPDMVGRDNHPLAEACIFATFMWSGLWVGLANRIPHRSWFFRMMRGLAYSTGRPIRDPVILDVIGPGLFLIGAGMTTLRIWTHFR